MYLAIYVYIWIKKLKIGCLSDLIMDIYISMLKALSINSRSSAPPVLKNKWRRMRRSDFNPFIVSLSESHSSEHRWAAADSVLSLLARRGRWARRRFVLSTFWMGYRGWIKGSWGTRRGATSFPVQQRRKQICSLPGLLTATCTPPVVPGITNATRRYPRQHKTHPDIYVWGNTALRALQACRLDVILRILRNELPNCA